MTVYVVAQLKFTDVARYRRYQAAFPALFKESGGRLLAADEAVQVLEGTWQCDKLVIMAFADAEAARSFLASPAYQAISEDRVAGAETVALLVQGLG